jgi:23S rRNA-/tRNA-specific pseudouridylate synthase
MSMLGHPILGDSRYWPATMPALDTGADGLFLSALEITFPHPESGGAVHVETPQPESWTPFLIAQLPPLPQL